jgi:hypothetical protein
MFIFVGFNLGSPIDRPGNGDLERPLGITTILRNDANVNFAACRNFSTPSTFHLPVRAAIEIPILGEMVEGLSRAIEPDGDIVPAVIG